MASVEDRFWFHVGPPDPVTGCREWRAGRGPKGYGIFRYSSQRRTVGAHRAALILTEGREIKGADVLHRCNNPACVEPTHLRWGTNAENMADRMEREGYLSCKKLAAKDIAEIRDLLTGTRFSQRVIGEWYGVSPSTIGQIKRGQTWSYV